MLRPTGNRILLKKVFKESKIHLLDESAKEQFDVFIEAKGPEVKLDIEIGDKVFLTRAAYVLSPIGKEYNEFGIVSEQDIWAVVI